jgi:hypothetical protein
MTEDAISEGRLAFGYVEDLLPSSERTLTRAEVAEMTGPWSCSPSGFARRSGRRRRAP